MEGCNGRERPGADWGAKERHTTAARQARRSFRSNIRAVCEDVGLGLVIEGQQRNGTYDPDNGSWRFAGPAVRGVLLCEVEERSISDFGFRIRHAALDGVVFHPETRFVDEGQPVYQLVQLAHGANSSWQGHDHVEDQDSIALAVGRWANEGPLPPRQGVNQGYPERKAMFDISFESGDSGIEADPFPQGHVWFDVWLRSEPATFVRFSFPIDGEGDATAVVKSWHDDVALDRDPLTGRPVPVLDAVGNDGP